MNPAEVVEHEVERERMHLVLELLPKGVREPCEPTDTHSDVQVLPLHIRRANVPWVVI